MPFVATVLFMSWGFWGMFGRAADVFNYVQEDMSFGWYVPIFSLYILWTEREAIWREVGAPSVWGLVASLPFMALALLGTRGLQLRFEQLGFIGLCVTIPWTFFGARVAKKCLFPAAYLLFTIPVSSFLDFFTIHLRLLASSTALGVLKGFGIDAMQKGTAIISQGAHPFQIDVAEPCSGLRSFFALTALTAAYAWFSQPTWLRRAILFACAAPIAVLGNVVRVLTICLVAAYANPDFALGFYHDYSGYVVFIVAIIAMVAVGEAISKIFSGFKGVDGPDDSKAINDANGSKGVTGLNATKGLKWLEWLALALFAGVFAFQAQTPAGKIMSAPSVTFPETLAGFSSDEVRYCQNEQCGGVFALSRLTPPCTNCPTCDASLDRISLGEHRILPSDTQFIRRLYRASSGAEFMVSAIIGGETKNSIHRPELCLPAQGYLMRRPADIAVGGRPFHVVEIQPPGGLPGTMAYTFFNQDGVRTASHVRRIITDVWDRSFHNRIDRWVMVTVHVSAPSGFTLASVADRVQLEGLLRHISEGLP